MIFRTLLWSYLIRSGLLKTMSLHGYHYSLKLAAVDAPFDALIMAAMRKAGTNNATKLHAAFPGLWSEFRDRYNAPMGIIPEDGITDIESAKRSIAEFNRQKL